MPSPGPTPTDADPGREATVPRPPPPASGEELATDAAQSAAETHGLRGQLAIAERDRDAARGDAETERGRIARWQDAFGLRDGDDPNDRVRETIDALDAKTKRVAALQAALGAGDGDDPEAAAAALRGPAPAAPAGGLPAWGRLLLLTQLAKHDPILGQQYGSTPDVLREPNGAQWSALRQESLQADGTAGHAITIQRLPSTFRYEEARAQRVHYEGQLASALRNQRAAEATAAAETAPAPKETARARLASANARVEEIRAALRDLEPRLVAPEAQEWRFATDLDGVGAAEA